MSSAPEASVGRPRKHGDELTETVSARVPESFGDYLRTKAVTASAATWDVLVFERALTEALGPELAELRISAAMRGQSYDLSRAETIARLVKLGLSQEKRGKK